LKELKEKLTKTLFSGTKIFQFFLLKPVCINEYKLWSFFSPISKRNKHRHLYISKTRGTMFLWEKRNCFLVWGSPKLQGTGRYSGRQRYRGRS